MNTTVDYTPVLLAQLTDLSMRITKQNETIALLEGEIDRLSGQTVCDTMRTSVPLRHHKKDDYKGTRDASRKYDSSRGRPRVATSSKDTSVVHASMSISDVLKMNEEVTLHVHTGKNKENEFIDAVATATFDGTALTVTACKDAPSIVGMTSSKPGEILYKFIDELKTQGVIKKVFTIAPWRLCFVLRDGVQQSLEQLRSSIG